ncbi:MAG: SIS domain-containing protein, partial [Bryobacteraceae bacterium]
MSAAAEYFERTLRLLENLGRTQLESVDRAAEICASSIAADGLVFLFGNGHSRMMCEEMTPRQGCFPGFFALVELALSN